MNTRNELQSFEDEFFKRIRENEVWKAISKSNDIPWSEKIIDKYADKWEWTELCRNHNIRWTVDMIEKFKSRIDWNTLSETVLGTPFREAKSIDWSIIRKFDSFWNWKALSLNAAYIPIDIVEQFLDKWDWKELIDNRNLAWNFDLFEKFKRYIPVADFDNLKRSNLWDFLVEIDQKIITGKILSEN